MNLDNQLTISALAAILHILHGRQNVYFFMLV